MESGTEEDTASIRSEGYVEGTGPCKEVCTVSDERAPTTCPDLEYVLHATTKFHCEHAGSLPGP